MRHYVIVGKDDKRAYYLAKSDDEALENGQKRVDRDRDRRENVLGVWEIVEVGGEVELWPLDKA